MQKKGKWCAAFCTLALVPAGASANSSWMWISQTRPFDVLPWVIVLTLAIETWGIWRFGQTDSWKRTLACVTLANLVSFLLPYAIRIATFTSQGFDAAKYINSWPSWIIGGIYLALTLFAELPLVYAAMRRHTASRTRLIAAIGAANVITTALCALIERTLCRGRW